MNKFLHIAPLVTMLLLTSCATTTQQSQARLDSALYNPPELYLVGGVPIPTSKGIYTPVGNVTYYGPGKVDADDSKIEQLTEQIEQLQLQTNK